MHRCADRWPPWEERARARQRRLRVGCRRAPLPEIVDGTHAPTPLDHLLRDMRRTELDGLAEKAEEILGQPLDEQRLEALIPELEQSVAILENLKAEVRCAHASVCPPSGRGLAAIAVPINGLRATVVGCF